MPIALEFEEPCTFRVRAGGAVTFPEVEDLLAQLEQHAMLSSRPAVLVDATEVEEVPSTSELRLIAASVGRLVRLGLGPVAIVTGSTFVYGVVRMFGFFAEAENANVVPFKSPGEAVRWLSEQMAERARR